MIVTGLVVRAFFPSLLLPDPDPDPRPASAADERLPLVLVRVRRRIASVERLPSSDVRSASWPEE
jgi:hypothetical protein